MNLEDALACVDAGCDALGFVFYRKSPRYITPLKARAIIKQLPKRTIKIGVFVDAKENYVRRVARLCKLDMLQFHGNESPEFCAKFRAYKIIKAFRIKDKIDFRNISRYKTFAWLFDAFRRSRIGGTGKKFNWKLLDKIGNINRPIFLSGGLTAANVRDAIKTGRPSWVDVSSGVEIRPGKKDYRKIKKFIKTVRKAAR